MRLPKIASAFLSATVLDCGPYRNGLKETIENYGQVQVPLQKHWADPARPVVDACEAHFLQQDAYIGLFAHRYGWVPPGFEPQSITRLEWAFAVQRWKGVREPPMFIFRPAVGSKADNDLKRLAKKTFDDQQPPASAAERAESARLQQAFWAELDEWAQAVPGGRMLNFFRTRDELEKKGLAAISHWNQTLLDRAAAARGAGVPRIDDYELGHLGREQALEQLQETLSVQADVQGVPGLAFAVHGPEGHGQWQLACHLKGWSDFEEAEVWGPTPAEAADAQTLARWACALLKRPATGAPALTTLTEALAARLAKTDVVLLLSAFGTAPDRWQRFAADLWQPLHDQLAARRLPHRVVWVVVDSEPAPVADAAVFWDGAHDDEALDTRRVVPLPALAPFEAQDVERWLKRLKKDHPALDLPLARMRTIAKAVTRANGLPDSVYGRLQNQGFWA